LYALNQTANIKLIGRTDGNNYVWVDGTNKCWVNANYLQIAGDPKTLPIVYPGIAKLPVSPYYPAPAWASATRNGNSVGVTWAPVVISPGKYEDENMHQYILEVWRCEAGRIIFETLGSNLPSIVVAKDEPGCSTPSRGRVFVQEKHGYAGPVEPPWPQPVQPPTSTPASDPSAFAQSIVNTLNTRNFTVLPALMDQSFSFAYWQSQGTSYPPDLAIEQLRTNHLGTTSLTSNASKDLNTLLGGLNPYSIMGLDPAKSRALFVSGWGLDGKAEAILYITQRVNGSLYWHSVLIAPTGFVRISTPTPTSLSGPYAVILVAENDVLNIRSGAGVSNPVVGSFPPDAINVMRTGPTAKADGAEWVEVQNPSGGTGWVNSSYLTEYFSHDAFCADTRITSLIQQLKTSMNQSDGLILSQLTSPKHGINVHLWAYQPAANLTPAKAVNAFTSTEIYNWGSGPRGEPDYGTFKDIIQPKMLDTLNAPNMETYCDNLTKVFPLYRPWPYPNIHYYNLYKPGTPGIDLDFRTWLIGVEYINYQPYIHSMVNIVWEP
ncbi:MAG TPA: SH3 domain-containing protein, partial [Anaerolineales bacterium]|nr:SH3 domain-containing protein [Anaerolineales bacterium]